MQSHTVSDRLRTLMQQHSLTIAALSERSGVSESTIGRILNNRGNGGNPSTLRLLASALGCSPAELTGQEEQDARTSDVTAAVDAVVDAYESRIADLEHHYRERTEDLKAICDERIRRYRLLMYIFMGVAVLFIAAFSLLTARVIWDLSQPDAGAVRYQDIEELLKRLGVGSIQLDPITRLFAFRG